MVAQFFRYPQSRVVVFDKGYSSFVLSKACGGKFFDVGAPEGAPSFYPLGDLSTNADASWAVGWIEKLVCMSGLKSVTPAQRNAITDAVNLLRESPHRTITDLKASIQNMEIRAALETYALGGPLGSLLDSDFDGLEESRFTVFEMEHLMRWGGGAGGESDRAVVSVLLYLFRRIEKNLDGSPTLIILDEAWLFFRDPLFLEYIRQWLATLRKLNGAVVIATQNPGDVVNSPIAPLVLQSCQTLVLLANPRAGSEQFGKLYQQLGLNQAELELLQRAIPKREYYVSSPDGKRMIYLGLGEVALSFVGVSSPDDRKKVKELIANYPEDWPARWLASRRVEEWGDYWRELAAVGSEAELVAD
jgi:type IV secretion system protein VirB4